MKLDRYDVVEGEVSEISHGGGMFRLNIESVSSRELRPWEKRGPTQFWYTFDDYHTPLPAVGDSVTLHLRSGSTTVCQMETKPKVKPKAVRKSRKHEEVQCTGKI